jgi:monovalent cation:H+ antiporter-2, CPA2 family
MEELIVKDVLLIFAVSLVLVLITHRFKIPSLVGFIVTGTLLGPYGLKLVTDYDHILILAEVGVVFLLFAVGLEFSVERLKKTTLTLFFGGTLQVLLTFIITFVVSYLLKFSLQQSVLFGCIISLSSTAAVLRAIEGKGRMDSPIGRIGTSILLYQDLIVIPMLLFLPFVFDLSATKTASNPLGMIAVKILIGGAALWLFQKFILQRLFIWVGKTKSQELSVILVLMLGLGIAWISHHIGFSYVLGAFIAGLLISTTPYATHSLLQISSFHYAFTALFFASLGMMIDLSYLVQHPIICLSFFVGILSIKTLTGSLSVLACRFPTSIALPVGLLTSQIGELSYLLALLGKKHHVIGESLFHFVVTITGLTLLLTPFLASWAFRSARNVSHWRGVKGKGGRDMKVQLKDHAIVCGFGPLGQALCSIMDRRNMDYLIVELNPKTIVDLTHRNIPTVYGDGASPEILYHCNIEEAKCLAIVVPDHFDILKIIEHAKKLNPKVFIITRTRFRRYITQLYEAGADVVISEELEGGIEMGRALLNHLELPEDDVQHLINEIRAFGSSDFF